MICLWLFASIVNGLFILNPDDVHDDEQVYNISAKRLRPNDCLLYTSDAADE